MKRTKFVARQYSGHTPSRQHPEYWENCTIPWFGLADVWQIRDGVREYVTETSEKISPLGLANSAARLLPKGTVILSRTASVGFSGILGVPMATTQDFVNWVCGPRIRPEYLLYVFRAMQQEFRRLTMGSTHQTIYTPDVGRFMTCVPPVDEQDRIVAFVRQETAKIDALVAKKERLIELLEQRRASLLQRAVTVGVEVDALRPRTPDATGRSQRSSWRVVPLKRLGQAKGGSGFPDDEQGLVNEEIPFFKVGDLGAPGNEREMQVWQHSVSPATARRLRAFVFPRGTVVFAKVGAALLLNRRRLLSRPSCIDNNMMGFMPQHCDSAWAMHWLACLDMRELMNPGAVPSINEGQLRDLPVAVPSHGEQVAIARFVDEMQARYRELITRVRDALARLSDLRASIVFFAVTGKIDVRHQASPSAQPLTRTL